MRLRALWLCCLLVLCAHVCDSIAVGVCTPSCACPCLALAVSLHICALGPQLQPNVSCAEQWRKNQGRLPAAVATAEGAKREAHEIVCAVCGDGEATDVSSRRGARWYTRLLCCDLGPARARRITQLCCVRRARWRCTRRATASRSFRRWGRSGSSCGDRGCVPRRRDCWLPRCFHAVAVVVAVFLIDCSPAVLFCWRRLTPSFVASSVSSRLPCTRSRVPFVPRAARRARGCVAAARQASSQPSASCARAATARSSRRPREEPRFVAPLACMAALRRPAVC